MHKQLLLVLLLASALLGLGLIPDQLGWGDQDLTVFDDSANAGVLNVRLMGIRDGGVEGLHTLVISIKNRSPLPVAVNPQSDWTFADGDGGVFAPTMFDREGPENDPYAYPIRIPPFGTATLNLAFVADEAPSRAIYRKGMASWLWEWD